MNNITQRDLYAKSNYEVATELGARLRAYRIALRLTQKEVAEKAGISVITLARFESGASSSISLTYFIGLLRAMEQLERVVDVVPEIPDSLYLSRKAAQRVRRKKL